MTSSPHQRQPLLRDTCISLQRYTLLCVYKHICTWHAEENHKCFKITAHFCLLLFSYILVCFMLVQIEWPHSETALYSIVWMYHNFTPVEAYLSCSFRLFLKFYYNQLCCNEYTLCTSSIVEWMLRSPIGLRPYAFVIWTAVDRSSFIELYQFIFQQ